MSTSAPPRRSRRGRRRPSGLPRPRRLALLVLVALGLVGLVLVAGALRGGDDPDPAPAPAPPAGEPRDSDGPLALGFETGDFSQWSDVQEEEDDRVRIVTDPVREGRYAARFEHRDGDYEGGGARSEIYADKGLASFEEGDDLWFGWSSQFDPSFPSGDQWALFVQWKQEGVGSPPLQMQVQNDQIRLVAGPESGWRESAHVEIDRGRWHDWVVHIRFSSDEDEGFVEAWHDGAPLQERKNLKTLADDRTSYLKQGIYRDGEGLPPAVVFQDAMTIGRSYDEVAPHD